MFGNNHHVVRIFGIVSTLDVLVRHKRKVTLRDYVTRAAEDINQTPRKHRAGFHKLHILCLAQCFMLS